MLIPMLYSKIHRATVTQSDLHYEGSISICSELLKAANLRANQRVEVYNITNGERFQTYAIVGGPGQIQINGAAARLAQPGDLVIIAAYADFTPEEADSWQPTVVLVDESNKVK